MTWWVLIGWDPQWAPWDLGSGAGPHKSKIHRTRNPGNGAHLVSLQSQLVLDASGPTQSHSFPNSSYANIIIMYHRQKIFILFSLVLVHPLSSAIFFSVESPICSSKKIPREIGFLMDWIRIEFKYENVNSLKIL